MSGTSCDGVDGVIAVFSSQVVDIKAATHLAFSSSLKKQLHHLQQFDFKNEDPFELAAQAAQKLMSVYAEAVNVLCDQASLPPRKITAIGAHGQTIRHRPELGYSWQLNQPALLVEKTQIPVIADFRFRDIAAGGQGAPLTPAFHRWLFNHPTRRRVVLNLGGIANITDIPSGIGFDTGPANTLMDAWIRKHHSLPYDEEGKWAASGNPCPALLEAFQRDPFFSLKPPKSTGQDLFNLSWIEKHLAGHEKPEDVQATLVELTAQTVSTALTQLEGYPEEVLVCGGGIFNRALWGALQQAIKAPLLSTEIAGLDPMLVEATAFAWLARQTTLGLPGNLPTATGAGGPRVLGAIYPL